MFQRWGTDHFGFYDFWFWRVFAKSSNNTIQSSNIDHLAYFGAPGVLKTAPACIFHHIWYGNNPGFNVFLIVFAHIWSLLVISDLFSGRLYFLYVNKGSDIICNNINAQPIMSNMFLVLGHMLPQALFTPAIFQFVLLLVPKHPQNNPNTSKNKQ